MFKQQFGRLLTAGVTLLALAGFVPAQNLYPQYPTTGGGTAGTAADQSPNDQFLASWLIAENQAEAKLARLTEERLTDRNVKSLAQMFSGDHTQLINRLQPWVSGTSTQSAATSTINPKVSTYRRPGTSHPAAGANVAATSPSTAADTAANGAGKPATGAGTTATESQAIDPVQFKTEISQRLHVIAQRTMSQQRGFEVDRSFLNDQDPMQVQMLATLEVAREHASPQLRRVIDDAIAATRRHLDEIHNTQARLGFPNAWRGMTPVGGAGMRP